DLMVLVGVAAQEGDGLAVEHAPVGDEEPQHPVVKIHHPVHVGHKKAHVAEGEAPAAILPRFPGSGPALTVIVHGAPPADSQSIAPACSAVARRHPNSGQEMLAYYL